MVGNDVGVDGRVGLHVRGPLGPPGVALVGGTGVSRTRDGHARGRGEGSAVLVEGVIPHLEVLILRSVPEQWYIRLVLERTRT